MEYNPGKHQLIYLTLDLGFTLTQGGLKGRGVAGRRFWAHYLQYSLAVGRHFAGIALTVKGA